LSSTSSTRRSASRRAISSGAPVAPGRPALPVSPSEMLRSNVGATCSSAASGASSASRTLSKRASASSAACSASRGELRRLELCAEGAYGARNVLQSLLAQVDEGHVEAPRHLLVGRSREREPARLGQDLEARCDVDDVSREALAVHDEVAEVDPDAERHALVFGPLRVALRDRVLGRHRTARGLVVARDGAAPADDVGRQDRSQAALDLLPAHAAQYRVAREPPTSGRAGHPWPQAPDTTAAWRAMMMRRPLPPGGAQAIDYPSVMREDQRSPW